MLTIKRNISAFLLVLFLGYLASITLFPHTHYIDGQVVTHSHPYSGTADNPGHTHNALQLQTISHLSALLMLGLVLTGLMKLFVTRLYLSHGYTVAGGERGCLGQYSLRGPPVRLNDCF